MAILSVNQLVSETRKAFLGKGYSFGQADDVARAIEWLAGFGHVPSDEITHLLDAPQEGAPMCPQMQGTSLIQKGHLGLVDVMAALDFYEAYEAEALVLSGLSYRVISCALIARRAAPPLGQFVDEKGAMLSVICQDLTRQDITRQDAPFTLSLRRCDFIADSPSAWPARITIEEGAYQMLKRCAFETYVPSSDQSREAGAGAGLNDND